MQTFSDGSNFHRLLKRFEICYVLKRTSFSSLLNEFLNIFPQQDLVSISLLLFNNVKRSLICTVCFDLFFLTLLRCVRGYV